MRNGRGHQLLCEQPGEIRVGGFYVDVTRLTWLSSRIGVVRSAVIRVILRIHDDSHILLVVNLSVQHGRPRGPGRPRRRTICGAGVFSSRILYGLVCRGLVGAKAAVKTPGSGERACVDLELQMAAVLKPVA